MSINYKYRQVLYYFGAILFFLCMLSCTGSQDHRNENEGNTSETAEVVFRVYGRGVNAHVDHSLPVRYRLGGETYSTWINTPWEYSTSFEYGGVRSGSLSLSWDSENAPQEIVGITCLNLEYEIEVSTSVGTFTFTEHGHNVTLSLRLGEEPRSLN